MHNVPILWFSYASASVGMWSSYVSHSVILDKLTEVWVIGQFRLGLLLNYSRLSWLLILNKGMRDYCNKCKGKILKQMHICMRSLSSGIWSYTIQKNLSKIVHCRAPEDNCLHSHHRENLRSRNMYVMYHNLLRENYVILKWNRK